MRVLITGGLGFIGSNLTHRLIADGHDVVALDNVSRAGVAHNLRWLREAHNSRFRHIEADVRDVGAVAKAVEGAEVVFHLAAQVAVTTPVETPFEDSAINAQGTLNVLEAARRQHRLPLVFVPSTNKVYGGLERVPLRQLEKRYDMP